MRLQIGRETRERRGRDFDRRDRAAVAGNAHALVGRNDADAGLCQEVEGGLQQLGTRAFEQHFAAGQRRRHRVGAGLDAIGQHAMTCAAQAGDAVDHDPRGPGAGNARPHLVEAVGKIANLRLAGSVLDEGRTARERRRHDRRMGAADRHLGKADLAPLESVRGASDHIAAVNLDFGAELRQRHDEQIDGPRADGATARHRHPRTAHAGDQRSDDPKACPHLGDELVGRGGVDDVLGGERQRLALVLAVAGALAVQGDVDAVVAEDALQLAHVRKPRHVLEHQRFLGEQARDHQREGGVLRPRDGDCAAKRPAADDPDAIHVPPPFSPKIRPVQRRPHCGKTREFPAIRSDRTYLFPVSLPPRPASLSRETAAALPFARACALRRLRFSRSAAAKRASRAARFVFLPDGAMKAFEPLRNRSMAAVRGCRS